MIASETQLLNQLRAISRYCILFGSLTALAFLPFGGIPLGWQISLALIALTIGIPHGAVDHLIAAPKFAPLKTALFFAAYLGVVALAIWAILTANLLGFQLVVLMSAIHFGLGDAAFIAETDRRVQNQRYFPKSAYLVASGFTPVLIPLVSDQSTEALAAVNPTLVGWAGNFAPFLFALMVAAAVGAIAWMLLVRRLQEAIDLALLLVLALVAPPLVAFAFYFGLWHALRHTGRISLELDRSRGKHLEGKAGGAFFQAFLAGIPALVLVLVSTIILGLTQGFSLNQQLLWYLLVVIWALTVPHMALTLKLDSRALKTSSLA